MAPRYWGRGCVGVRCDRESASESKRSGDDERRRRRRADQNTRTCSTKRVRKVRGGNITVYAVTGRVARRWYGAKIPISPIRGFRRRGARRNDSLPRKRRLEATIRYQPGPRYNMFPSDGQRRKQNHSGIVCVFMVLSLRPRIFLFLPLSLPPFYSCPSIGAAVPPPPAATGLVASRARRELVYLPCGRAANARLLNRVKPSTRTSPASNDRDRSRQRSSR